MDEKLVTILTFTYPSELFIVRGHLEAEGIECFTQDELTVQVNPFYSNAIGGIKLQIKESDVERAVEILKESGYLKENENSSKKKKEKKLTSTSKKCPVCGSTDVSKLRLSGAAFAISILLLGFPIPFLSKKCHCFNCGAEFIVKGII